MHNTLDHTHPLSVELRECPFCGGHATLEDCNSETGEKFYWIEHKNKFCHIRFGDDGKHAGLETKYHKTADKAVSSWNTCYNDRLQTENARYKTALTSIANNTCCDSCREAALVARGALEVTQYSCYICDKQFMSTWSDEEAQAEYQENFGNAPGRVIVCDDCYKKVMGQ